MRFNPLVGLKKIGSAIIFLFHHKRQPNTIVVYGYPKFVFFWPLWMLGFVLWAPLHYGWISNIGAGWTWLSALTLVMIALGFQLSRDKAIFAFVFIGLIWALGLWLHEGKHVLFFSNIFHAFFRLQPGINADFGLVGSIIMSVLGFIMIVDVRLNDRWVFSPNTIEHYQFGSSDISIPRGAKLVNFDYPDTAELLLLGAGRIQIIAADNRSLVREIDNVPLLKFHEKALDQLDKSVSVRNDDLEAVEIAAAQTETGHEHGDPITHEG
jgi:hypothetical protein